MATPERPLQTQNEKPLGGEASVRLSPDLVTALRAEADEAARRGYPEASNAYHVSANMVEHARAGSVHPSPPQLEKEKDDDDLSRRDGLTASGPAGSSRSQPAHSDKVGAAMWALWDHLKTLGHPFASWPDDVKETVSVALIADDQTLTEAEIAHGQELAKKHGWLVR